MAIITLSDAATGYRDWVTDFEFTDADTGELIDFTGAFIAISVYDNDGCERISATTLNGMISIISTGLIHLYVPFSSMNLESGSYNIGGYYQLNGDTPDLIDGTLTVKRGFPRPS